MIEQAKETYTWEALYRDGTSLREADAPQSFASVNQSQIQRLRLCNEYGTPWHVIDIPSGATAVFFRRRSIALNPNTDERQSRPATHCIGWKREQEAVYLFVMNDGSILLTDNLQAV